MVLCLATIPLKEQKLYASSRIACKFVPPNPKLLILARLRPDVGQCTGEAGNYL